MFYFWNDVSVLSFPNFVLSSIFSKRTQKVLVRELMFADDTAFVTYIHQNAQEIITLFAQTVIVFRLKINIKNQRL